MTDEIIIQFHPTYFTDDTGCFWTDLIGCAEDCAGSPGQHSLLKTDLSVFVPAVAGRDYRPYARLCPSNAPAPPANTPPPTSTCQQVPVYGQGAPSSGGGPSEGGSAPATIIGYTTVCAP